VSNFAGEEQSGQSIVRRATMDVAAAGTCTRSKRKRRLRCLTTRGISVNTSYSERFVERVLAVTSPQWLADELARTERRGYIFEPLRNLIAGLIDPAEATACDFGCGRGASTICLGRLGFQRVIGIDPKPEAVEIAKMRAQEWGLSSVLQFECLPDTLSSPFPSGHFDLVLCNAVLEHIPPSKRREHLTEIGRVLKHGGLLVVNGTPNRWFAFDGHTTKLWLVPYMPLRMACAYARLRGRVWGSGTVDDFVAAGIRGVSLLELRSYLPKKSFALELAPDRWVGQHYLQTSAARPDEGRLVDAAKVLLVRFAQVIAPALRPMGIPMTVFLPQLSMVFRKR